MAASPSPVPGEPVATPAAAAGQTGGSALARNSALNLLGWTLPVLVGLATIPALLRGFGEARYGLLSLAWTVVGYFTLLDLGLGRALTQGVARRLGTAEEGEVPQLVRTGLLIMAPFGVAIGLVGVAGAGWLVRDALEVPPALVDEAVTAFRVLALGVPFLVLTAGLRGVLEARQWFGTIMALRVPLALITFVAPLLVLPFSTSLVPAVAMLVLGRAVLCVAHWRAAVRAVPALPGSWAVDRALARGLVGFGGWITVTNVVSPLLNHVDRFVIGAVVSVSALAPYATAQELATKLWLITAAVLPVFFPAFAASWRSDRGRTAALFDQCVRVIVGLVFPAALVVVACAPEALTLWVDAEFARAATLPLQWLTIAVYVNTVGQTAFNVVQASGEGRLLAVLQLVQLPLFLVALHLVLPTWGIAGASIVWAVRMALDTASLLVAARGYRSAEAQGTRTAWRWLALTVPPLVLLSFATGRTERFGAGAVLLGLFAFVAWRRLVLPGERAAIEGLPAKLRAKVSGRAA